MFIINVFDDIIVIIIITINHIMFQDLYHFGFCTKYNNNESENLSNTKMYPDPVLIYVNGLLLLKCTLMCQIYKML